MWGVTVIVVDVGVVLKCCDAVEPVAWLGCVAPVLPGALVVVAFALVVAGELVDLLDPQPLARVADTKSTQIIK